MPTVVTEGQYRFVIHTNEKEFEPPHVHVLIGGGDNECRIRLNDGIYMDDPPPGNSGISSMCTSSTLKRFGQNGTKSTGGKPWQPR